MRNRKVAYIFFCGILLAAFLSGCSSKRTYVYDANPGPTYSKHYYYAPTHQRVVKHGHQKRHDPPKHVARHRPERKERPGYDGKKSGFASQGGPGDRPELGRRPDGGKKPELAERPPRGEGRERSGRVNLGEAHKRPTRESAVGASNGRRSEGAKASFGSSGPKSQQGRERRR